MGRRRRRLEIQEVDVDRQVRRTFGDTSKLLSHDRRWHEDSAVLTFLHRQKLFGNHGIDAVYLDYQILIIRENLITWCPHHDIDQHSIGWARCIPPALGDDAKRYEILVFLTLLASKFFGLFRIVEGVFRLEYVRTFLHGRTDGLIGVVILN
ncbi:MAG TPA: hypothetical protein PL064_14345, partial [Thermogutta sp.]|nr:hypothetical protein [Thermogutta sp.]